SSAYARILATCPARRSSDLGVLHPDDLDELFRQLPRRHAVLRKLIDPRAESGPETLVRLMLRSLGAKFDVQVRIHGVGRVDFVRSEEHTSELQSRENLVCRL